jgi:hypothetical protein
VQPKLLKLSETCYTILFAENRTGALFESIDGTNFVRLPLFPRHKTILYSALFASHWCSTRLAELFMGIARSLSLSLDHGMLPVLSFSQVSPQIRTRSIARLVDCGRENDCLRQVSICTWVDMLGGWEQEIR